jgi:ankyrin repeat protein
VVTAAQKCSDFYMACLDNKVEEVKKMLETLTQDEIDRIEPNGSTALHTAAFHDHADIVRLLLDRGADRAIQNKFQCLPFDEAADDETKELFLRISNTNRFVSNTGAIEWELIEDDALEKAMEEREIIKTIYQTVSVEKMFE